VERSHRAYINEPEQKRFAVRTKPIRQIFSPSCGVMIRDLAASLIRLKKLCNRDFAAGQALEFH
jgi:hypothetical protein